MKKGVKGSNQRIIRFSKKWFYGILALGMILLAGIGVYAATSGSFTLDSNGNFIVPNPGHSISDVSPPSGCGNGNLLELVGTNGNNPPYSWSCATPSAPPEDDSSYLLWSWATGNNYQGPRMNTLGFAGLTPGISGETGGGGLVLRGTGCPTSTIGTITQCGMGNGNSWTMVGDCQCACVQLYGGTGSCQSASWQLLGG